MEDLVADPLQPAVRDVEAQLRRLLPAGFVARTGAARLGDLERYVRAAERRLERLPTNVAPDRDRMNAIHELEQEVAAHPHAPQEARWLLEELRVNQFAQGLGTRGGSVSAKRIRRVLADSR
jgi:ATP-dependent helicase HrpA